VSAADPMKHSAPAAPQVIDYRAPGAVLERHPTFLKWFVGALGLLLVAIIAAAIAARIHSRKVDLAEMRRDLIFGLDRWVGTPYSRYEIQRPGWTGGTTKYYRVRATPAFALQLVAEFDRDLDFARRRIDPGVPSYPPAWWGPTKFGDIIEFDEFWGEGESRRPSRHYWISPSTGWVYIYWPGEN
jgi:hypothetical protein